MNKGIAPDCTSGHCILHCHPLMMVVVVEGGRRMPVSLKNVLDKAVKIINFVKS